MISGYCEEKYIPVKKIFENYFLEQEEIGASFAIYKEGKPLIDLWNGFKNKNNKNNNPKHYGGRKTNKRNKRQIARRRRTRTKSRK